MNPNWSDAQNWLDILDHIWIGLVVLLGAAIPSIITSRTHRSVKTETRVIRDQLVNGHKTYLRDDLDRALAAIELLSHDVAALRHDLQLEQSSRHSQINDLRDDVDRMRRR